MEKTILYCDSTGRENTELVLAAAKKRAIELKIKELVVATTHGGTAIRAKKIFDDPKLNLVAVGIAEGYRENGWCFTDQEKLRLEKAGVKPLVASHALGDGVASSFTEKSGGRSIEEVVRDTVSLWAGDESLRRDSTNGSRCGTDFNGWRGNGYRGDL